MTPNKEDILHLTLFKKWFDEILSGKKTEEYRDLSLYWTKRLWDVNNNCPREYKEIWFRNGYGKMKPFMKIEFKSIEVDKEANQFIIHLGKLIDTENV